MSDTKQESVSDIEAMLQFISPIKKNSTFSESGRPIRLSRDENTSLGEFGGLYHVTIKNGFEFGFLISRNKFFRLFIFRAVRTE